MKIQGFIKDIVFSALILCTAFIIVITLHGFINIESIAPMMFVMAVFLVSIVTKGHKCGIFASLISVIAVNFAFTFPYFEFSFSLPENIFSCIIMLFVAIMTSALTTNIKKHERMQAENAREKMRANLLRAISHDLRTPLTTIYGSCSTILSNYDSIDQDKQIKLLKDVCAEAEWLNRMVENLLSVTRINSEEVSVKKTLTVLEELIDAVIVKFKKRYPDQKIDLDIPEAFIVIAMDPILIEQVIINLFENAVFHAKGMSKIMLRIFIVENSVVFEISDDGCGFPKDKIKTLFTGGGKYSSDSGKRHMGIGLAVCATIIKAHGGEIHAENRVEGGAVVRFSLEMEEDENGQ